MAITIYSKNTGNPVKMIHMVDAKEAVRGGEYTFEKPPVPIDEKKVVVEKKVEDKKVVEEKVVEPVEEKAVEPVKEEPVKEEIAPKRKIIRK